MPGEPGPLPRSSTWAASYPVSSASSRPRGALAVLGSLVADEAGGKTDDPRIDGRPHLVDQDEPPFVRRRHDHHGLFRGAVLHVFPPQAPAKLQMFALEQNFVVHGQEVI